MSEERIILGVRWFSTLTVHIGVVAARTGMHDPEAGEWQAYVNVVLGVDPDFDAQYVAKLGAKLLPEEAAGFFPQLDLSKYKHS